MSVVLRSGTYGNYYGSTMLTSSPCSSEQQKVNATYIYSYLSANGWTKESVAALLGNMQAESSINPGRWQSDRVGGDSSGHGYGLCQWTPYTKYTEWAVNNGYSDYSVMDANLSRILYEVKNKIQWYGTGSYSSMSFEDFSKSTEDVGYLAVGFLLCYERPADQSESVQEYRSSLARNWYSYLGGVNPSNPSNPSSKKKKNKFKFILFNRRRRSVYG